MADGAFTWFHPVLEPSLLTHDTIHVPMAAVIVAGLVGTGAAYFVRFKNKKSLEIPEEKFGLRNFAEMLGEFIYSMCQSVMGPQNTPKFFPIMATVFSFILFSNLLGLLPGFLPPTENLNTTLAGGFFVFVYYNIQGFKENGIGYLKHFAGPVWYLAPLIFVIEIISNLVRPLSLALRLRGNMMGDHLVLGAFYSLYEWVLPIPIYFLGIMVCVVQAVVFTMLTMVYVSLATAHEH